LDLACGRQTRAHDDVDLCLFREHNASLLRFFEDWEKAVAVPGEGRLVCCRSERDVEPPRHELHFCKEGQALEFLLIDRERRRGFVPERSVDPDASRPAGEKGPAGPTVRLPRLATAFQGEKSPSQGRSGFPYAPPVSERGGEAVAALLTPDSPSLQWLDQAAGK
jgi:hypothetical protein